MELRHLRYFVAVADTGAFSRAAVKLRITQPALWRQVRDLEKELGVPLVERVGRRARVTSAGESLLGRSRALLADVERFIEHAQAVRGGNVGSLSVAGSPQVIQNVLAPFLARYLKSREQVNVHLLEEGGVRALARVESGEAHLAVAIRHGNDQLEGRLLFPFRVVAALPPGHRLGRRATIDVTDLQDEHVLLLRHGFGTREMFDAACRIAHVHVRLLLEAGDPQSLIALAEAGRGIAIVPSTVAFTSRRVRGAALLHAGASLGLWGWIVWSPDRFLPPFARSFIDGLVMYTRRTYPGRALERVAPPVPRPREGQAAGWTTSR